MYAGIADTGELLAHKKTPVTKTVTGIIILLKAGKLFFVADVYEFETDAVNSLEFGFGLVFEVLAYLGNEYVHTAAQEVIVLTPNVHQYLVAL